MTSRSAAGKANEQGYKFTLSTTLKMAVLAPMPSARVATATIANRGILPQRPGAKAHILQ